MEIFKQRRKRGSIDDQKIVAISYNGNPLRCLPEKRHDSRYVQCVLNDKQRNIESSVEQKSVGHIGGQEKDRHEPPEDLVRQEFNGKETVTEGV